MSRLIFETVNQTMSFSSKSPQGLPIALIIKLQIFSMPCKALHDLTFWLPLQASFSHDHPSFHLAILSSYCVLSTASTLPQEDLEVFALVVPKLKLLIFQRITWLAFYLVSSLLKCYLCKEAFPHQLAKNSMPPHHSLQSFFFFLLPI